MKKTRYTEEQIAFALKQAETGNRVEKVCRKMGISEATFYNWKKKFGGMGVTELRRLRQLEEENQRLKRLVAPNAFTSEFRTLVISLVRDKYPDFGPTFACEKLRELHELALSAETLRKWMVEEGLWRERRRKTARIYQRRQRRPCYGELIQIDGSPHDWFEERGPRCTLIVFIDDATSALMAPRFAPSETTRAYMETLRDYLDKYGRPLALYSDRHSIFRVNNPEREGELTQFTRAIKTLGIEPIHANSPQAKGRVERANQTLQDRLVKELRLRNISDIETANLWLSEFVKDYNSRFASIPRENGNAHREILHSPEELNYILSYQSPRVLSKNLTFQYKTSAYQIRSEGQVYRLRHAIVTVCENFNGEITVLHESRSLGYEKYVDGPEPIPLDDEKSVHERVDNARFGLRSKYYVKPAADHPWMTRRTQSKDDVKPPTLPRKKVGPDTTPK